MPKKTTILILILAAVTAILLYLAVTEGQKPKAPQEKAMPTKKVVQKTAAVLFSPQTVDLSSAVATPTSSVDLLIDTGGQDIAGVQIEAQYDPKSLTNLKLTPSVEAGSFFGANAITLFNEINPGTGRISYAVAIPPNTAPKRGIGKIATIAFTKTFGATASATTISFLDKTMVTVLGENESVLKETVPLNIILSSQPTRPPATPIVTQ